MWHRLVSIVIVLSIVEIRRNKRSPGVSTKLSVDAENEWIAEPVSRDHVFRRERGQGENRFPCSADQIRLAPKL